MQSRYGESEAVFEVKVVRLAHIKWGILRRLLLLNSFILTLMLCHPQHSDSMLLSHTAQ